MSLLVIEHQQNKLVGAHQIVSNGCHLAVRNAKAVQIGT